MTYYVSLSNGVYNGKSDLSEVEWELDKGGQRYVIITKKPISSKQYQRIAKILSKKGK